MQSTQKFTCMGSISRDMYVPKGPKIGCYVSNWREIAKWVSIASGMIIGW